METVNLQALKQGIANKECNGNICDVRCYYCKHWNYNQGKILFSAGGVSHCTRRKEKTYYYNWCKKFEKILDK